MNQVVVFGLLFVIPLGFLATGIVLFRTRAREKEKSRRMCRELHSI